MLDRDTSRPPKEGFLTDRPDLLSFVDRISLPRRTGMNPKHGIDRMWLSTVTSDWPTFREAAIDWLATRPGSTAVDLLSLDDRSLNEEFTLLKSEIRRKILKVRESKDVQNVHHFFILGEKVGEGVTQESILRITRREMLQLYIIVYARKYLIWKYLETPAPDVNTDESSLFDHIDKIMRAKPYRGGPLLNVR